MNKMKTQRKKEIYINNGIPEYIACMLQVMEVKLTLKLQSSLMKGQRILLMC